VAFELLKTQKNDFLGAIRQTGLAPFDFEWSIVRPYWREPDDPVPVLVHVPSRCYFAVGDFRSHEFEFECRPGLERQIGHTTVFGWNAVMNEFRAWLERAEREWNAPDLWAGVMTERELAGATGPAGPSDETSFTEDERALIADQLQEIRELIVTRAELNEAQIEQLDERLDYVQNASSRLTRRDWANIFVSSILSFAIEHALGSEVVSEVLRYSARTLGHLFGGDLPGLPPGV
jgi:hypothetical protein